MHADGETGSQLSYKASSKPEAVIQPPQNAEPDHPTRIHSTRFQVIKRIFYCPTKVQRTRWKQQANNARRRIGPTAIIICAKESPKPFIGGTFAVSVVSLVLYWIVPMINNFNPVCDMVERFKGCAVAAEGEAEGDILGSCEEPRQGCQREVLGESQIRPSADAKSSRG